jgi:hypothetical protein
MMKVPLMMMMVMMMQWSMMRTQGIGSAPQARMQAWQKSKM